jgi:hypothetical protein
MTMISEARVEAILHDCMYTDEEMPPESAIPEGTVMVEGVVAVFGLHPGRLESYRAEVAAMLEALPDSFHYRVEQDGGGVGDSFLRACQTRDGELWTDQHRSVEQLVVLGIGLGYVIYLLPRGLWGMLPGGLPVLIVDTSGELVRAKAEARARMVAAAAEVGESS